MFGETGGWAYALMWLPQLSQYVTHVLVCVLFSHRGTEKGEEELTWNPQGFWYWRRARGTSFTKARSLDCVSLTYWTDTNPQKGKTHPDSGTSADMEYGSVLATLPAAPGMLLQSQALLFVCQVSFSLQAGNGFHIDPPFEMASFKVWYVQEEVRTVGSVAELYWQEKAHFNQFKLELWQMIATEVAGVVTLVHFCSSFIWEMYLIFGGKNHLSMISIAYPSSSPGGVYQALRRAPTQILTRPWCSVSQSSKCILDTLPSNFSTQITHLSATQLSTPPNIGEQVLGWGIPGQLLVDHLVAVDCWTFFKERRARWMLVWSKMTLLILLPYSRSLRTPQLCLKKSQYEKHIWLLLCLALLVMCILYKTQNGT